VNRMPNRTCQAGAALLMAMLTVALVATLSATAYWRQWQAWAVEQAERQRVQSAWLLVGALDWARLILREDVRASNVDHLAEPWSVPLQEARISSFVASSADAGDVLLQEAFLAGAVIDEQGKLNFRNLLGSDIARQTLSAPDMAAFRRLFDLLGLPLAELNRLGEQLPLAFGAESDKLGQDVPLPPARMADLAWSGLSPMTLQTLAPHVTWLPERTPLNLNTTSAVALHAASGMNLVTARQWIEQRERRHYESLSDATSRNGTTAPFEPERYSVTSRYFLVSGQLRLDGQVVHETSLVVRDGLNVRTLWRQRGVRQVLVPLS
jgi:general secretion pathway protein K